LRQYKKIWIKFDHWMSQKSLVSYNFNKIANGLKRIYKDFCLVLKERTNDKGFIFSILIKLYTIDLWSKYSQSIKIEQQLNKKVLSVLKF